MVGAAWSLAGVVAGTAAGAVDEAGPSTGAATEPADALVVGAVARAEGTDWAATADAAGGAVAAAASGRTAVAGSAAADCVELAEPGVEVGTMEAAGPGDGLQAISRRTAQAARQTGRGIGSPP